MSRPRGDLEAAARVGARHILLIEDGVLCAVRGSPSEALVRELLSLGAELHALEDDLAARGLSGRLAQGVRGVGYGGFVELVERHEVVNWL